MKTITVKGTFLQPQAAHLESLLKDGKSVLAPVFFKETVGNKIEATVDEQTIGYAEDGFELPKLYDAKLVGLGPDPLSFIVDVDCADTSAGGGDYAAEKALIDFDIVPEEEVDLMIKCMEDNRVHPVLISRVLSERVANASANRCAKPKTLYQDGNPSLEFSYLQDALICALNQEAILFEGEKSTGKNVLCETLAWLNGKPFYRIGMSAGMDMDSVFGGKSTDNSAAERLTPELAKSKVVVDILGEKADVTDIDAAAEFELMKALSASIRIIQNKAEIVDWAKNGGVLLFDEMNMAEGNFLQALVHPLADGGRELVLPGGEGVIKLHPHCVLTGGMNPVGSDYAGTRELNEATASRLARIQVEMPEDVESLLRANFPEDTKLGRKHFKACSSVYKDFKAAVSQGRVSKRCLNIRGFVRALADVEKFPEVTSLAHRITIQVLNSCLPEERMVLDAMVRDKITF